MRSMNHEAITSELASLKSALQHQGIEHLYLSAPLTTNQGGAENSVDLAFIVSAVMEETFSLLDQVRIGRQIAECLNIEVTFFELNALLQDEQRKYTRLY